MVPCSLRAVKIMLAVSSPMRHSAMREGREAITADRPPRLGTVFTGEELTTFTVRVCPLVPGFSWSTFTNTGFRFAVCVAMDSKLWDWSIENLNPSFSLVLILDLRFCKHRAYYFRLDEPILYPNCSISPSICSSWHKSIRRYVLIV